RPRVVRDLGDPAAAGAEERGGQQEQGGEGGGAGRAHGGLRWSDRRDERPRGVVPAEGTGAQSESASSRSRSRFRTLMVENSRMRWRSPGRRVPTASPSSVTATPR